ncbi:hypothetical protein AVEN_34052-1 [Araneus ventricosus]|uniref:Uncharacterized protein n=1 Tax=Araneus ventricosus TaxID=182803 RepID=A0A4Y2R581_ARAVE|nr:hypothetical protein AVEN_38211-1 [Araneus ventricosus]GBN70590.1 hypothetical protein AVEN_34052-1 [Araneus ventricosus]
MDSLFVLFDSLCVYLSFFWLSLKDIDLPDQSCLFLHSNGLSATFTLQKYGVLKGFRARKESISCPGVLKITHRFEESAVLDRTYTKCLVILGRKACHCRTVLCGRQRKPSHLQGVAVLMNLHI